MSWALGDAVTEFCFHNLVCKCILHLQKVRSGLDLVLKISVMVKYLSFQNETNCSAVNGKEWFKDLLFVWYLLPIKTVWCLPEQILHQGYILKWSGNKSKMIYELVMLWNRFESPQKVASIDTWENLIYFM